MSANRVICWDCARTIVSAPWSGMRWIDQANDGFCTRGSEPHRRHIPLDLSDREAVEEWLS